VYGTNIPTPPNLPSQLFHVHALLAVYDSRRPTASNATNGGLLVCSQLNSFANKSSSKRMERMNVLKAIIFLSNSHSH
jgi:hypothetical protein